MRGRLVIALWAFASVASGQIIYVDHDAPGDNDGMSWEHAYNDLQDALAVATTNSEMRIAGGRYVPDGGSGSRSAWFSIKGMVRGAFAGFGATIPDEQNPVQFETILSGDLFGNDEPDFVNRVENSFHVIYTSGSPSLEYVTVSGGNTAPSNSGNGGGARVSGSPTFYKCSFVDNEATQGGALWLDRSAASFSYCVFRGNRAFPGNGGAAWVDSDQGNSFKSCFFENNQAVHGGAFLLSPTTGVRTNFKNCVFRSNTTLGGAGGAALLEASALFINCTFLDNTENAIAFTEGVSATILNSVFWGNGGTLQEDQIASAFSPSLRYCVVQGWTGSWGGHWNRGDDPMFADSMGRLSASSPYIDFGDNEVGAPEGPDFDGNPRFVDAPFVDDLGNGAAPIVDRGAFEYQASECSNADDPDCDGIDNVDDNCPDVANEDQLNFDGDEFGDACDPDMDNDDVPNAPDVCDFTPAGVSVRANGTLQADLDGDCDVDLQDFSIMFGEFTGESQLTEVPTASRWDRSIHQTKRR